MELLTGVRIAILLLSAAHASRALSFTPFAVCTAPAELICSTDCMQLLVCLGDGAGGLYPSPVANCTTGQRCSAAQGACVAEAASECEVPIPDPDFTCHSIGSFPDPYDCQKYHVCIQVGAVSQPGTCDGTTAYNPLNSDCSLSTADRVCTEGPIQRCTGLGQMGVVPENPAIYYICAQKGDDIIPEMYRCPGSQIFDTSVAACVDPTS